MAPNTARALPEAARPAFQAPSCLASPRTPDEARKMVDDLKSQEVDGIKTILESGTPAHPFPRFDHTLLRAVAEQSQADGFPIVCHIGDLRDVEDASMPTSTASNIPHASC